jgi:hypothetical protein
VKSLQEIFTDPKYKRKENSEAEAIPLLVPPPPKEMKLKSFPDDKACLPNEWIRAGLWSASNIIPKAFNPNTGLIERAYYIKKPIPTFTENCIISYTGYHLGQLELKAWMTAVREGKTQYLQRILSMSSYEFLEAARIPRCGKNKEAIYQALEILFEGKVSSQLYKDKRRDVVPFRFYHDSLLYRFGVNKDSGKWEIALSEQLAQMFESQTSWIDWNIWNSLRGEVTKALMLHVCSHEALPKNPQKISYETLIKLLGVSSPLRKMRPIFDNAGRQFLEKGIVSLWDGRNDILTFVRPPKKA